MATPAVPTDTATTTHVAPDSLSPSRLFRVWIALTFIALLISIAQYTPLQITLQLKLADLDPIGAPAAIGVVVAVSMLAACIFGPLAGLLSDHTRSRIGMRRPWIIAGAAVGLGGTAVVAFASDPLTVGIGWTVANVGYSVANLMPIAMLSEQVPERHRGLVAFGLAGAGGIAAAIGAAIVTAIADSLTWPILLPAIAAMVLVPLLLLLMPDRRLKVKPPRISLHAVLASYWVSPRGRGAFVSLLVAMFLVNFGSIVFTTYLYFVLLVNNHIPEEDAPAVFTAIAGVGGILFVIAGALAGVISDKWGGRKGYFVASGAVLAAAMLGQAFVHGVGPVLILTGIQYAASGVIFVFGYTFLSEVTDLKTAGRDAGVYNTVITLAAVVGPLLAALLIAGNPTDFTPIFVLVTTVTAIGAGFIAFNRHLH